MWRSLVARLVRDEEVVGSNPAIPTRAGRCLCMPEAPADAFQDRQMSSGHRIGHRTAACRGLSRVTALQLGNSALNQRRETYGNSMSPATVVAASLSIAGVTWLYVSRVTLIWACPRRSWTTFG
jgi:hypothetical protein